MSAKRDEELSEFRHESRVEVGKQQLRLAQLVLTAFAEGLGINETAARVGRSRVVVWRLRVWLGVQRSNHLGKGVGRRDSKRACLEVRP